MLIVSLMNKKNCKCIREQTKAGDIINSRTSKMVDGQDMYIRVRNESRWTKRVTELEGTGVKISSGGRLPTCGIE